MDNATSNHKTRSSQSKNLFIFGIVVMILLILFVWMLSKNTEKNNKVVEKLNFSDPLKHADSESIVLEKIQHGVEVTKKQTEDLKKQFNDELNTKNSATDTKSKELEERLATIEKKLNGDKLDLINPNSDKGYQGMVIPSSAGYGSLNQTIEDGMREDKLTLSSIDSSKKSPFKNPETYVPAGTVAQAVMLSGADASAAVTSSHNPNPMIFRIISNGSLPNHKKSHLKNCVVMAFVSGDISSERGEIDLYKLSCTFSNNEIIDPKVEGWIFGGDGKYGVRGTPVWREGALLQRAFAAGTLSGISDGVSQAYTMNSVSPLGTVQTVNSGDVFKNGAAKGASKAMDKLADYNIQRAEQYHPVIQISPGDVVDVVFKDGFFLDGKKHDHDDDENKSLLNMFDITTSGSTIPATYLPSDEKMLPLSVEQVKRLQEKNKNLGFRITNDTNS